MKITESWLRKNNACNEGKVWFLEQKEIDGVKVVEKLIAETKFDWANWLIVRIMTRKQKIAYAIFAAEQVVGIYEERCSDDKRPRLAIEAAKAVLKKDTEKNRAAAYAANAAANAAAYAAADAAAYAAANAAYAAANAAYAAANAAADAAAYAANAAANAAYAAANAAANAAYAAANAAANAMKIKILKYGLTIIWRNVK